MRYLNSSESTASTTRPGPIANAQQTDVAARRELSTLRADSLIRADMIPAMARDRTGIMAILASRFRRAMISGALIMASCFAMPVAAKTIVYDGFASTEGLTRFGSTAVLGSSLELTRIGERFAIGGVHFTDPLRIGDRFAMSFDFTITAPVSGVPGDGLVAMLQRDRFAVGPAGGALGYYATSSLAIEFDTYRNSAPVDYNEPNGNHIAVQSCGIAPNTPDHASPCRIALAASLPVSLADGSKHRATIAYEGSILRVDLDGIEVLSTAIDISALLELDPRGEAMLGLVSPNGGATEQVLIDRIEFSNEPASPVPVTAPGTLGMLGTAMACMGALLRRPTFT